MKKNHLFILITIFVLGIWGCKKTSSNDSTSTQETATSGEIYITVDENFKPIIEAEIDTYQQLYPKAKIHALYLPGEEAIRRMVNSDSFRMAIAARNLSPQEEAIIKKQNTTNRPSCLAIDAIALITNKSNPDSMISIQQMKDIMTGKITEWKQINPASKLGTIMLVFDNEKSGTVQFLRDSVLDGQNIYNKAFSAKDSPDLLEYTAKNPAALGVIGVNWVSDHDDEKAVGFLANNRVLNVESPIECKYIGKHFQPYPGVIKLGCYPLIRHMYSLNREPGFRLGTGFIAFLSNGQTGQRIILKAGLVPMFAVARVVRFPEKK